ncbi:MAG: ATP synthase F1 subunit epsilon [Acidimicrobiales bacterium]
MEVQVVSPERILYTGEANFVLARTRGGGDIAFLTNHAPFIGALDIHQVVVRPADSGEVVVAVHGGFVEVSSDRVTILSDVAELPDQVDRARAEAARERARAADDPAALRRAELRLEVARNRG